MTNRTDCEERYLRVFHEVPDFAWDLMERYVEAPSKRRCVISPMDGPPTYLRFMKEAIDREFFL